jgi:microcompartment protein CcmK/EutM
MRYGESGRNRRLAIEAKQRKNFKKGILMIISFMSIFLMACFIVPKKAHAADNTISIDQVGSGNQTTILQEGSGHSATITTGSVSPTDYNVFSIIQQGAAKTATIELKAGINNTFNIQQDGTGNHIASIQNMIGSGNNVNVSQSGAGNHTLTVTNPWNATNNGNTVTATQSGGVGADKTFNLYFSGATGAGVTINQTNPTQPDQAGMNIQCNPCGSGWSYTKF